MPNTILIVDDDLPTLELYQRELGREYRVLTCTGEREALAVLSVEDVKALIIEPVALGDQGWARVAAMARIAAHVPVVVCSTQDERRRGRELGAVACLVKPVLPTTLLDALHQIAQPVATGTKGGTQ